MYATPRCLAHPNCQTFWLGDASGAGRVRGRGMVPRRGTSPGAAGWVKRASAFAETGPAVLRPDGRLTPISPCYCTLLFK